MTGNLSLALDTFVAYRIQEGDDDEMVAVKVVEQFDYSMEDALAIVKRYRRDTS